MQVEGVSDDFIVGRTLSETGFVKIRLSTSSESSLTSIYFHNNASLGLDIGYDASIFGGDVSDLALYSHLVADNDGMPMAIQAVNSEDISNVIIPLGVTASQYQELRFSVSDIALSNTVNIYLEDVVANTITLLNNTDYVLLPQTNISGTGRFFLRITEGLLSITHNDLDTLDIFFVSSSKELIIRGKLQESTLLMLYDFQGRKVLESKLDLNVFENHIKLSSLNQGVYVVELSNQRFQKSKKVVVN
jgi:hypothetical protein